MNAKSGKKIKKDRKKIKEKKASTKHHMTPQQIKKRQEHVKMMHQKNLERHHAYHSKAGIAPGHHHPLLSKHIMAHKEHQKISPKARREIKAVISEKLKNGGSLTSEEKALHAHVVELDVKDHKKTKAQVRQHMSKGTVPTARNAARPVTRNAAGPVTQNTAGNN